MRRLRRSRLLPRALWLAARAAAPVSSAVGGRLAFWLWYVPWQRGEAAPPSSVGTRRHRLVAGGREVDVFETGTGPAVLLVHGWADRAASLQPIADALLAAGWRVVAVDLPGHGDTPGARSDAIVQSAVVTDLLARFEVRAVVAHSLGAVATARALRAGGDDVERVAFLAPVVRLETVIVTFLREVGLPATLEAPLRRCIERHFGPDVWDDVATDRNLAGSDRPGVVIHDEHDRRAPLGEARALVDAWPGARLHTTSGLGHRRLLADPDVIARTVEAITGDLGGSRAAAS